MTTPFRWSSSARQGACRDPASRPMGATRDHPWGLARLSSLPRHNQQDGPAPEIASRGLDRLDQRDGARTRNRLTRSRQARPAGWGRTRDWNTTSPFAGRAVPARARVETPRDNPWTRPRDRLTGSRSIVEPAETRPTRWARTRDRLTGSRQARPAGWARAEIGTRPPPISLVEQCPPGRVSRPRETTHGRDPEIASRGLARLSSLPRHDQQDGPAPEITSRGLDRLDQRDGTHPRLGHDHPPSAGRAVPARARVETPRDNLWEPPEIAHGVSLGCRACRDTTSEGGGPEIDPRGLDRLDQRDGATTDRLAGSRQARPAGRGTTSE
ncbi:hypothetical protein H4V99_002660 [Cryobacterium sp. CG_9.6]|nr:hypothetical protein [Cryobacterium sp. CG_9.6]